MCMAAVEGRSKESLAYVSKIFRLNKYRAKWIGASESDVHEEKEGPIHKRYDGGLSAVTCLKFNREGSYLAFGTSEGEVFIFDSDHKVCARRYPAHEEEVVSLSWTYSGDRLVSFDADGNITVASFADTESLTRFSAGGVLGGAFRLSSDGRVVSGTCNPFDSDLVAIVPAYGSAVLAYLDRDAHSVKQVSTLLDSLCARKYSASAGGLTEGPGGGGDDPWAGRSGGPTQGAAFSHSGSAVYVAYSYGHVYAYDVLGFREECTRSQGSDPSSASSPPMPARRGASRGETRAAAFPSLKAVAGVRFPAKAASGGQQRPASNVGRGGVALGGRRDRMLVLYALRHEVHVIDTVRALGRPRAAGAGGAWDARQAELVAAEAADSRRARRERQAALGAEDVSGGAADGKAAATEEAGARRRVEKAEGGRGGTARGAACATFRVPRTRPCLLGAALSHDGHLVYAVDEKHDIVTWDARAGHIVGILSGPVDRPLCFGAVGRLATRRGHGAGGWLPRAAAGGARGQAYLWESVVTESSEAYAPGFEYLEACQEYVEKEDEFDVLPEPESETLPEDDVFVDIVCDGGSDSGAHGDAASEEQGRASPPCRPLPLLPHTAGGGGESCVAEEPASGARLGAVFAHGRPGGGGGGAGRGEARGGGGGSAAGAVPGATPDQCDVDRADLILETIEANLRKHSNDELRRLNNLVDKQHRANGFQEPRLKKVHDEAEIGGAGRRAVLQRRVASFAAQAAGLPRLTEYHWSLRCGKYISSDSVYTAKRKKKKRGGNKQGASGNSIAPDCNVKRARFSCGANG